MARYTFQQLKDLWAQAGGNPQYGTMAAAVAMAESGGNPNSTNHNQNGTVDRGLWQINSIHGSQSTFDPMANARSAVAISHGGSDWRPWCTAWSNGRCGGTFMGDGAPVFKFLPDGTTTGTVPNGTAQGGSGSNNTAPATSPVASAPPGVPFLTQLFGNIFGLFGNVQQWGFQVEQATARWFMYLLLWWVIGPLTFVAGLLLVLLSSNIIKSVFGFGARVTATSAIQTKVAQKLGPKETPTPGVPEVPEVPVSAPPEPTPTPRPEPLFPVGQPRSNQFKYWENLTDPPFPPPRPSTPRKVKARVGKHRGEL